MFWSTIGEGKGSEGGGEKGSGEAGGEKERKQERRVLMRDETPGLRPGRKFRTDLLI